MNAKSPMVMVNVHQAKTQFSRLLARAEAGEEVVIARNGDPVARLVGLKGTRGTRRFGALRDRIVVDDRFFEPLRRARWPLGVVGALIEERGPKIVRPPFPAAD